MVGDEQDDLDRLRARISALEAENAFLKARLENALDQKRGADAAAAELRDDTEWLRDENERLRDKIRDLEEELVEEQNRPHEELVQEWDAVLEHYEYLAQERSEMADQKQELEDWEGLIKRREDEILQGRVLHPDDAEVTKTDRGGQGRPTSYDRAQAIRVCSLHAAGVPIRRIADRVGLTKSAVQRLIKSAASKRR